MPRKVKVGKAVSWGLSPAYEILSLTLSSI